MTITNAEYIADVRRKIVEIAHFLINGKMSFIEGAQKICSFRWKAEVPERDPDFDVFTAIDSETDALPNYVNRQYWSENALKKLQPEIDHAEKWAREIGLKACHSLIDRFGATDSDSKLTP